MNIWPFKKQRASDKNEEKSTSSTSENHDDERVKIRPFSRLTINGFANVELIESDEWSLAIEGKESNTTVIDEIYHYEGGNLIIDGCDGCTGTLPRTVITQVSSGGIQIQNIGNNNDNRTIVRQTARGGIGNISGSRIGSIVQVGINHGTINTDTVDLWQGTGNGVLITISAPKIPEINLNNSGTVFIDGFPNQSLDYRLRGSGDIIHHNVKAQNARLEINGSGDITLDGIANKVQAQLVGSGDIDIRECATELAEISLIGSGDIYVNAQVVRGQINGSGDLHCTPAAKEIDVNVFGHGKVRKNRG